MSQDKSIILTSRIKEPIYIHDINDILLVDNLKFNNENVMRIVTLEGNTMIYVLDSFTEIINKINKVRTRIK